MAVLSLRAHQAVRAVAVLAVTLAVLALLERQIVVAVVAVAVQQVALARLVGQVLLFLQSQQQDTQAQPQALHQ